MTKIEYTFINKMVQKLKLSKNVNTKFILLLQYDKKKLIFRKINLI